jgi:hypothetical protein
MGQSSKQARYTQLPSLAVDRDATLGLAPNT